MVDDEGVVAETAGEGDGGGVFVVIVGDEGVIASFAKKA